MVSGEPGWLRFYFTFLRFGFARFAAGLARLDDVASIAAARILEMPSRCAICSSAALNPMPFLAAMLCPP